ncbi:MAG: DNA-directed RNA polymerase subunit alpha [Parcubacteria group bacterium Gr01-1014_31]|nr:MAG: DNA-directed RNA polymerase subunit alpha [Parcubacteria group bacterium Gr01-1014_31]
MEHIPLPTTVTIVAGDNERVATVAIEPFFPGYGTTVGNSLRRVLLSSLPGAAITSFNVKGVQHEFSALPGIKEDFVEIALNLKQVRLKVHSAEPVRLKLAAHGEMKVTAGDITGTSEAEVINKDLVIATLTDKSASLEIEVIAKQGRGYEPTEAREKEELEVGMIALDALFSPVRKVGFQIESVRVGQMTNWDKLVLQIETDGTISPKDALLESGKYLIEHFTFVVDKVGEAALQETEAAAETKTAEEPVAEATEGSEGAAADGEPKKPKKKSKKSE